MSHPYLGIRYQLEGVITLVDAVNAMATLDTQEEAVRQIAVADRLVLSKIDLVTNPKELDVLNARLKALNPAALLQISDEVSASFLLDCGLYSPASKSPDVSRWLRDEEVLASLGQKSHRHTDGSLHILDKNNPPETHDINRHDASIRAFSFSTDKAISAESFTLFQELLRSAHGPKLLRLKAIVKIAERPENPVIIHGVQHVFHKPIILEKWPDKDKRTRFVFITKNLEPDFVLKLWEAFLQV